MTNSKALYFVALVPPSATRKEVLEMKQQIRKKFGVAHALKLPAHITLIPPVWLENEQEEHFVKVVKIIAEHQPYFPVELKGFGHFGQRVIFINVVSQEPIQELHGKLLKAVGPFLPEEKNSNLHPHITLATRDLTRDKFPKVWEEFKNRSYQANFQIKSLTIFKHNGKTWDLFEELDFSE